MGAEREAIRQQNEILIKSFDYTIDAQGTNSQKRRMEDDLAKFIGVKGEKQQESGELNFHDGSITRRFRNGDSVTVSQDGNKIEFYDAQKKQTTIEEKQNDGTIHKTVKNRDGSSIESTIDAKGKERVTATDDGHGHTAKYHYDQQGNLDETTVDGHHLSRVPGWNNPPTWKNDQGQTEFLGYKSVAQDGSLRSREYIRGSAKVNFPENPGPYSSDVEIRNPNGNTTVVHQPSY